MQNRRDFLKKAGMASAAAAGTTALATPYVHAQSPIRWRLQTYAGAALAEHVVKPAIDAFNKAANGEMEIELYYADQLVPTGELFRAMQNGTIRFNDPDKKITPYGEPVTTQIDGSYTLLRYRNIHGNHLNVVTKGGRILYAAIGAGSALLISPPDWKTADHEMNDVGREFGLFPDGAVPDVTRQRVRVSQ